MTVRKKTLWVVQNCNNCFRTKISTAKPRKTQGLCNNQLNFLLIRLVKVLKLSSASELRSSSTKVSFSYQCNSFIARNFPVQFFSVLHWFFCLVIDEKLTGRAASVDSKRTVDFLHPKVSVKKSPNCGFKVRVRAILVGYLSDRWWYILMQGDGTQVRKKDCCDLRSIADTLLLHLYMKGLSKVCPDDTRTATFADYSSVFWPQKHIHEILSVTWVRRQIYLFQTNYQ